MGKSPKIPDAITYTETNIDVPKAIVLACKQSKLKKYELASILGVSTKTLWRQRKGLRLMNRIQRQTLATLLNSITENALR